MICDLLVAVDIGGGPPGAPKFHCGLSFILVMKGSRSRPDLQYSIIVIISFRSALNKQNLK